MGAVHVGSREDRDKLHDYLVKRVGAGAGGNAVSSAGAPPNCVVSHRSLSSSKIAQIARGIGITAEAVDAVLTPVPVKDGSHEDYPEEYHSAKLIEANKAKRPFSIKRQGERQPVLFGQTFHAENLPRPAKDSTLAPVPVKDAGVRCTECGKMFKNVDELDDHQEETGHFNYPVGHPSYKAPAKDSATTTVAGLLALLWAWYHRQPETVGPSDYDLNTYRPAKRTW